MRNLNWEVIDKDDRAMCRAKVPGGWIIRESMEVMTNVNETCQQGYEWRTTIAFIPDPAHAWVLGEPLPPVKRTVVDDLAAFFSIPPAPVTWQQHVKLGLEIVAALALFFLVTGVSFGGAWRFLEWISS